MGNVHYSAAAAFPTTAAATATTSAYKFTFDIDIDIDHCCMHVCSCVWPAETGVKGLSGLMSQYAQDDDSNSDGDSDDQDVDTSVYNVEAGLSRTCIIVIHLHCRHSSHARLTALLLC